MSLLDEPKNQPGTAQIIGDTTENEGHKQQSQAWLRSTDDQPIERFNKSTVDLLALPTDPLAIVADAVAWLSASALTMKFFRLVAGSFSLQLAIAASILCLALGVACVLAYDNFPSLRKLISYRLFLIILGFCVGGTL